MGTLQDLVSLFPGLIQDQEWDWPWGITARTLCQAPPVRAWLCWELLVGVGSWAGEVGVLPHSWAVLSAKKRARSEGKFSSLPNSSITSNQTCFLGLFSVCGEASHCYVLLLDTWDLGCSLRFSIEQWSYSSAGWDQEGLREGTGDGLGVRGRALTLPGPTPSPRTGPSPPHLGSSILLFHLTGLILFNWTLGVPLASERQLSWPTFTP